MKGWECRQRGGVFLSFPYDDYAYDAHDNSNTMTNDDNLFAFLPNQAYLALPAIASANNLIVWIWVAFLYLLDLGVAYPFAYKWFM